MFVMSDLVIESVIREGLEIVRRDPTVIDDVFAQLKLIAPMITRKYGDKEIQKIKDFFINKEVSIIQSFSQVQANMPCVSIQLLDDSESAKYAHLDDFELDVQVPITDPEELAALVIETGIPVSGYDPLSGTVSVPDSVDLSKVHVNHIFVDADQTPHTIVGGIVNENGAKQFLVAIQSEVQTVGNGEIKSSINYKQYEQRGVVDDEKILLGIHTEERLLTIYLYVLIKYFILSRKKQMIERGFKIATFSGSDFTRNLDYHEPIFSRYLTVSGITQNNWISDKVIPIDLVEVEVKVPKDVADNEDLGLEDSTVQVAEDE